MHLIQKSFLPYVKMKPTQLILIDIETGKEPRERPRPEDEDYEKEEKKMTFTFIGDGKSHL